MERSSKYESHDLAEALVEQKMYRLAHPYIQEADDRYNDMTRKIIAAYKDTYPDAVLGRFNSMSDVVLFPVPSRCLNFCADFIVSKADDKLCDLVRKARESHWDEKDYGRMWERLDELVGISLDWT